MTDRAWATRVARELTAASREPGEDNQALYRRLTNETLDTVAVLEDRVDRERLELEELVQVIDGRLELECELQRQRIAAAEAVLDAVKVRRRLERAARNAETRARRAIGGTERDGVTSRHVRVDPSAWQTLAQEARRRQTALASFAGQIITEGASAFSAGAVTGHPSSRRRRSPGEGVPRPVDRVVRLRLASDSWQFVAAAAASTDLSAARYAGEVLEAAAHALDWRAQ